MLTRQEASKELKKRGYKKDDEPGIWMSPQGGRLAWFLALKKEGIEFAITENEVTKRSNTDPCLTADNTPKGIAIISANIKEENASSSVLGILPNTSSVTGLPVI
mgnify:CR=1 FL=1